jgi:hypothetical protein
MKDSLFLSAISTSIHFSLTTEAAIFFKNEITSLLGKKKELFRKTTFSIREGQERDFADSIKQPTHVPTFSLLKFHPFFVQSHFFLFFLL